MYAPIPVARSPGGALTYRIPVPPEALPAVTPAALLSAWALARTAADRQVWGPPRLLVFARPNAEPPEGETSWAEPSGTAPSGVRPIWAEATEIAIADADASAWAEAIDSAIGLGSLQGLSLCLRLLALVELLTRAPDLAPLYEMTPEGIELHPMLLAAAASMPLDSGARFDAAGLRGLLSATLPSGPLGGSAPPHRMKRRIPT